ncbi:MAG: chemotaxis protein CheB [Leptolyngbyaceae cyanobacterium MO_188.B28]|nr:chemotaxis protein CheB [Leptolyngbyaceae cyanobacterium MO_188.B28]
MQPLDSQSNQLGNKVLDAAEDLTDLSEDSAFDIVALAASKGGLKAPTQVLSALPKDFSAPVLIVHHLDPRHTSLIADILSRRTPLAVKQAEEGDALKPGTVFIAPPNRHLLVNPDNTLSLNQSELAPFVRPSADLLYDSVAASHKERSISLVLTGTGGDGSMACRRSKK